MSALLLAAAAPCLVGRALSSAMPAVTQRPVAARSPAARMLGATPTLCVFDLDACLWDKEMYEMPEIPDAAKDAVRGDLNGRGEGVKGVMSGRYRISLHAGALVALQGH